MRLIESNTESKMHTAPLKPWKPAHDPYLHTSYASQTKHAVREADTTIKALNSHRNHLIRDARAIQDEIELLMRLKVEAVRRKQRHLQDELERTDRRIAKQIGIEIQHDVNEENKLTTLAKARTARQNVLLRNKQLAADVRQDSKEQLEDLRVRRDAYLTQVKSNRLQETLDSLDLKRAYTMKMGNKVREARERNICEMDELNRDRLQKEQLVQDLRAQEIALLEDNEELRRLLNEERKGIPKTVLATKGRLGMVRAYEADFNEQISSHATVPYRHDIEYMGQRTCKSIWDCKDLPPSAAK